jgi:hypothetical protein
MSAIQAGDVPTLNQNTTGSAATLTTARTIALTGDVTYTSGSFNGSANVTGTATLANSGATAGTYGSATNIPQIAVDAKGRITSVSDVAVSIPSGSLTFTGDVTGTGSTGSSTTLTLAAVGTAGTYTKVTTDSKGRVTSGTTLAAGDIPNLDAAKITSGVIDAARLPSYVDDVVEAANLSSFPATGETGKIYVALDTNKVYRWSGTVYVYITSGAVDSVAGKTGVVTLVAGDVGLGNVENKSSATIRSEITSGNVTAALGFTPYNATNPSGYITSAGTAANVSGTVAIANGGTGATTAAGALTNLGAYAASNPSGYTTNTGTVTSVAGTGTVSGLTLTGTVTGSGNLTLGGTLSLTSGDVTSALGFTPYNATNPSGYITSSGTAANVSGTVAIANGGTGQTTRQAAMDALAGAVTSGQYLRGDGTDVVMSAIQAADVPTLNQNTTGTAANVTGIVAVANGGTGTATPGLVAGTNITVSGSFPNQTINAAGGSSTLTINNKTAAYTVVAGDLNKIINCTSGTFTVSLTTAATLGAGFNVTIWNTSSNPAHNITVDPNGAETIDGAQSIVLRTGEGTQIVCDGTNWQTGNKKSMRAYAENMVSYTAPIASGDQSLAIGSGAQANGTYGLAIGAFASATNTFSIAIGASNTSSGGQSIALGIGVAATGTHAVAIGKNSGNAGSQAVTSAGAMALGGSYASGVDSFAANVVNNTSSYGATALQGIAIGNLARASQQSALALGGVATASGNGAVAIATRNQWGGTVASGAGAVAIGDGITASGQYSFATGFHANATLFGKYNYASGRFSGPGDAQYGILVLRALTTTATPVVLTSDGNALSGTNQLILPNNSAYAFTGIIVARRKASDGTASAAWQVTGLIRREGDIVSTVLVDWAMTTINNTPGWTLALSADTTNGGLAVTATGAAATNIRWVATLQTSEVTYA